jgi:hypothetical protein
VKVAERLRVAGEIESAKRNRIAFELAAVAAHRLHLSGVVHDEVEVDLLSGSFDERQPEPPCGAVATRSSTDQASAGTPRVRANVAAAEVARQWSG